MNEEIVSADLLAVLQEAQAALNMAQVGYNAITQGIIRQYKLNGSDSLDLITGIITREKTDVNSQPIGNGDDSQRADGIECH
jgi:hypothetical protein